MMVEKLLGAREMVRSEKLKSKPDAEFMSSAQGKVSYWEAALYSYDYWHGQEVKSGVFHAS